MKNQKIISILSNTSWYIYNFRLNLIKSLINKNYIVITIAPHDSYTDKLINIGCDHHQIILDSNNKNPFKDLLFLFRLQRLLNDVKADVLLNFTAKPNIFGTFAAKINKIPCINNIAGLGTGFVNKSIVTRILKLLYYFSQRNANKVFFQNLDDLDEFIKAGLVKKNFDVLPGSGVDLSKFNYCQLEKRDSEPFIFLFVGRMLYSKGVKLLFEASKEIFESNNYLFKIILIGESNVNSQDSISNHDIESWNSEIFFNYIGKTDNVYEYIKNSHCIILPSFYREGTPKSILEGLASGRPIITTNMPGCKTTVKDGYNGYLVNPRDLNDLFVKMKAIMDLSIFELKLFGMNSRSLAEKVFDEKTVINKYLNAIEELV